MIEQAEDLEAHARWEILSCLFRDGVNVVTVCGQLPTTKKLSMCFHCYVSDFVA
jgi:hypothetical protein